MPLRIESMLPMIKLSIADNSPFVNWWCWSWGGDLGEPGLETNWEWGYVGGLGSVTEEVLMVGIGEEEETD